MRNVLYFGILIDELLLLNSNQQNHWIIDKRL